MLAFLLLTSKIPMQKRIQDSVKQLYVVRCVIWYYLHNFKNVKNTHGEVLLLVKLQASRCNFTKSNASPSVFFTFFKLYKWYKIAQCTTYSFLQKQLTVYKLFPAERAPSQFFDKVLNMPLLRLLMLTLSRFLKQNLIVQHLFFLDH